MLILMLFVVPFFLHIIGGTAALILMNWAGVNIDLRLVVNTYLAWEVALWQSWREHNGRIK